MTDTTITNEEKTPYRKKLLNEDNGAELAATRKRKRRCQRSTDSLKTPGFVRRVHGMIDENPGKSMRDIMSKIFKRVRFMPTETTRKNRLIRAKRLLNGLKHPEEQGCL
ncbi:unnamed protein product [Hymenolepis diminuta]|uniref:Uncharacterized protein n=1 Tax=Hymenolepis diminuta TaxID=6216 RepID=A0A0R3SQH8_HYMDI|nr:unnamed protein product [Hymenolepis diminuta]